MTLALLAEDIRVRTGADELVRGVSIGLAAGEALTIVGETGSGKSLLVQAMVGVLPVELTGSGRVSLDGRTSDVGDPAARRPLWGRIVSLLPQEPWSALDPTMRAGRQVEEVFRLIRGQDRSRAGQETASLLGRLGVERAAGQLPSTLSGGMAQRVAFAATRAGAAPILIADEPTKGLDAQHRDGLVAMLRAAVDEGVALLTITHDLDVARQLGGRLAVMLDGAFVEEGPTAAVLTAPRHAYTRALLAAEPRAWPEPMAPPSGAPLIEARGVSKRLGGRTLFADLDLEIAAAERIALAGPSGAGKTTLGNLLLGLLPPDRGRVRRCTVAASHRFQKLYQDPPAAFSPHVTTRTTLRDLVRRHDLDWQEVERLMARTRLSPALLDRRPDQISGGELQRFALVRVLLVEPLLLLADEPTSRLDPITQQQVMELLLAEATRNGIALLMVTHDPIVAAKTTVRTVQLGDAIGQSA